MLDISVRKENSDRAIAYFDGLDARVYRTLVSKLRSEEAVQNAIILYGLIGKIRNSESKRASEEVEKIQKLFPRLVGVSYKKLDSILDEL